MEHSVFTLKFSLSEPACQTGCQQKRSSDINVLSTALTLETRNVRAYMWHDKTALEWIPTTDNKKPKWQC